MASKRIKDWETSIISFRSGDVIAVDGPGGTAKMSKDNLLKETAQNALAGNVAPAFVPNETNATAGMPYVYGGKLYEANENYSGAWNAAKFALRSENYFIEKRLMHPNYLSNVVDKSILAQVLLSAGIGDGASKLSLDVLTCNQVNTNFNIEHKVYNANGKASNNNDYDSVYKEPVKPGDIIVITSSMYINYYSLMAYNAAGDIVDRQYTNGTVTNQVYVVPENVSYVTCQSRNPNSSPDKHLELAIINDISGLYKTIKGLSEKIDEKTEDVYNHVIDKNTGLVIDIDTWSLKYEPGKYGNTSGGLTPDPSYNSWVYEVNADTTLYCVRPSNNYFSVSVTNAAMSSGTRYRKTSSENTLPTEENPITISAGQKLIITEAAASHWEWSVHLPNEVYAASFSSSVPLAGKHIEQVESVIKNELLVQYFATSGENYSTERVYVYVPTKVGYCRYIFFHSVNSDINCDVWRIGRAEAVDDNLIKRYSITIDGEWEMALHLDGRSDFSGGVQHGDEVLVGSPVFMVDGEVVNLSDIVGVVKCKEFRAVTKTDIYDPADNTTVYAEHGCEHIFTTDGVFVNQSVKWLITSLVTRCYLAMNMPRKVVSSKYYTDKEVVATPTPSPLQFRINGVYRLVMFDDTYGVQNEFSLGRDYPSMLSESDSPQLFLYDHGTDGDNKGYFVINDQTPRTVEAGTIWKAGFFVSFKIGK
jgi:hypothetical protein